MNRHRACATGALSALISCQGQSRTGLPVLLPTVLQLYYSNAVLDLSNQFLRSTGTGFSAQIHSDSGLCL